MRRGNLNSDHNRRRAGHHASFKNEWLLLGSLFKLQAQPKQPVVLDHKTFVSRFKSKPQAAVTDAELIRDYLQNKSQPSFTRLYYRHKAKMMAYIWVMVRDNDDAQDVLHNAWERVIMAFMNQNYHEEEAGFGSWFKTICYREAKDWNIRKVRLLHGEEHMPDRPANELSTEQRLINEKTNGVLHRALKKLEKQEKDIVIMRALKGNGFPEIAAYMNMNVNSVRTVYFRTIKKLKELAEMR